MQYFVKFWFEKVSTIPYRVCTFVLGIACFCNVVECWSYRHIFFSEYGLVGARNPKNLITLYWPWHIESESMLFGIHIAAALASIGMITYIYPRLSLLISYLWLCTYACVATTLFDGGDLLLRTISLVLLFSPLADKPKASIYGLRLIQLQLFTVYWTAVYNRIGDPFWFRGEAINFFLLSFWSNVPSAWVIALKPLWVVLNYYTLFTESLTPILLSFRKTAVFGLILGSSLHIGIAVTSSLVVFSLAALSMYPAFLGSLLQARRCEN